MEEIRNYLQRTESAARHIFGGIDELVMPIRSHRIPCFVGWGDSTEPFEKWARDNEDELREHLQIQQTYVAELHAIAVLCGSILQIAHHAFQLCSTNTVVADELRAIAPKMPARFCVGRIVKGVPLGLVVYVGRNQHMHCEEGALRSPSSEIFDKIVASPHQRDLSRLVLDEHLLCGLDERQSLAKAFFDLLLWRSYEVYESDMIATLEVV